jgi:hypothetical protein
MTTDARQNLSSQSQLLLSIEHVRAFAKIALFACRDEIVHLIAAAFCDRMNVVAVQNNLRRPSSTVLAGEFVA